MAASVAREGDDERLRVFLAFGDASRERSVRATLDDGWATLAGVARTPEELERSCRAMRSGVVLTDLWLDAGLASEAARVLQHLPVVWLTPSALGPSPFVAVSDLGELPLATWLAYRRHGARGLPMRLRSGVTTLVDALPEPVLLVDARGEVVACSPGARALLGGGDRCELDSLACWRDPRRTAEVRRFEEHPVAKVVFGGASEAHGELSLGLLAEVAATRFPAEASGATPRCAWVRLRKHATASSEDRARHGIERQRMELVGRMAAGIAHDFNNVMTAVLAFAEFAREEAQELQVVSDLNELLRAGQRAARLTRKLLMLGRSDDQAVPVDVNDRLQDLTPLLRRSVRRGIALSVVLSEEPAHVLVDPIHLDQVVLNLVVNARDAISGAGTIEVRCEAVDGAVRVSVSDDGSGISEENLARVFEPGFTTKAHDEGTGLGLSTSRELVRALGGEISVVSALGQGTRFVVDLPTSPVVPSVVPEHVSDVPPPRVAGELALVVDGDPEVLRVTSRMLYAAGYRVEAVPDARAAERALRALRSETRLLVADTDCVDVRRLFALAARVAPRAALLATCSHPVRVGHDAVGLRKPYTRLAFLEAVHDARVRRRTGRRLRVLLVEPDERARKLLSGYLRRDGHEVQEAVDLAAAEVALGTVSFDVVVTEEVLPDGLATKVLALAGAYHVERRPAVIALSSSLMAPPEQRLRQIGFDEVIPKPVDPRALTWAIDEHTRTAHWVLVVSDDPALRATLDEALDDPRLIRGLWCDTDEAAFVALEDWFELAVVDDHIASHRHGLWKLLTASRIPTLRVVRRPASPPSAQLAGEITAVEDVAAVRDLVLRAAGITQARSSLASPRRRGSTRVARRPAITLRVPELRAEEVRRALAGVADRVVALMASLQEHNLAGALSVARELTAEGGVGEGIPDVATLAAQVETRCQAGELDAATRLTADLAATVGRLRILEVER